MLELKWEEIISAWGYQDGLQGGGGIWDGKVLDRLRMGMKIPGKGRQKQGQGVTVAWWPKGG